MYYIRVSINFYYILLHYALLFYNNACEIPNNPPHLLLLLRVGLCEYDDLGHQILKLSQAAHSSSMISHRQYLTIQAAV